jgi:GT2 family glycosyltransferase
MVNIYVSIVNYNGYNDTIECLRSLEKVHVKNISLHVVIVDNASTDSFHLPSEDFKTFSLTVLNNNKNLGFAGGHNRGIHYALDHEADHVMILNNDTFVDKNILQELLQSIQSDKNIGITAPKIYFAKGYEFHKDRYKEEELGRVIWYAGGTIDWGNIVGQHRGVDEVDQGQYDKKENTGSASGCCMFIRREILEKIGVFDERYFLYYEDSDYNERVKKAVYTILYIPKAVLWHKNAGSTGGSGSSLQDYYISRNRLLFGFSYANTKTKIALVSESLRLLISGREWQKIGIKDFYIRKFGKGSYRL